MTEDMNEMIQNAFSDLQNALYGLPFKAVDRSKDAGRGPFFDIVHVIDNEPQYTVGFVAWGYEKGGWFGGFFGTSTISDRKETMRGALVWLLNAFIDKQIGK